MFSYRYELNLGASSMLKKDKLSMLMSIFYETDRHLEIKSTFFKILLHLFTVFWWLAGTLQQNGKESKRKVMEVML